jgi:transposase InsO family protein
MEAIKIKEMIEPIRKKMPRYGTEKLHLDIAGRLKQSNIKMGRDRFLKFCRNHHLLVPKTRRCFITTDSNHRYHKSPNLIKELVPAHAEQVFVSDITYIKLENRHAYLALVTDLYSKKVMGYKLDDNMKTSLVKDALQMAIKNKEHHYSQTIHHSDRGIQYCFPEYTDFAVKNQMILSTTEKYDPYENAVAERINQTLKYEFGLIKTIPTLDIANKMLKQAVKVYNNERRHRSLQMQTPGFAHTHQKHTYKSYRKKPKIAEGRNVDKV